MLRFVEEIIAFTFMSYNETVMKDLLRIIPKKGKVVEGGNSQESPRKGSTNSSANPILTNFIYYESLSILPPSEF